MVIAEVEFGQVAVQMVMGAMLVNALHATLEDREEALDGIGMDVRVFEVDVFLDRMTHYAVIGEEAAKVGIAVGVLRRFVSHDVSGQGYVRHHDRAQGRGFEVVHDNATRLASGTVDQGEHFVLVFVATAFLLALRLLGVIVADEGFVDLNRATVGTEDIHSAVFHGFADSVAHEPSGLQGNAQSPMQLIGADALLAAGYQEDSLKPEIHRDMAGFENGANLDGKGLAAVIALVSAYAGTLAVHLADALHAATVGAYWATRPKMGLYELVSGLFIVKVFCGKNGISHDY